MDYVIVKKIAFTLLAGLTLAACAPQPQHTIVNPRGFFASGQAGQGQAVTVAVSAAPGALNPRDAASPKIALTPSNNYVNTVGDALVKGLRLQGYNATRSGAASAGGVNLTITRLTTDIVKGTTTDEVHAQAQVIVAIGATQYTFTKSMVREIPLKASEETASTTTNDMLGLLISDIINAPKIQGALTRRGPF